LEGLHPGGHLRQLAPDKQGSFWRPDVSFDGARVLFCYKAHDDISFHLYEINLDGTGLRQLTAGDYDDIDPIYLPDGHIVFTTTRANTYVRCMPYTYCYVLARCDADGKNVYMRSLPFDLDGKRRFVTYVPVKEQQGDDLHLFCPTGFLDDSLWHRTYWGYGRAWASGAGGYHQAGRVIPAGRPLVFDDETVYGYGRLWKYYRWTTPLEFQLFAANKQAELVTAGAERKPIKKGGKRVGSRSIPVTRFVPDWSDDVSVQINSMVLTDSALFAAGPPDVQDEEQSVNSLFDPQTQKKLAEQSAAFEGKRGALLVAVSAALLFTVKLLGGGIGPQRASGYAAAGVRAAD